MWVTTNYYTNILEFWKKEDRSVYSVEIQVKEAQENLSQKYAAPGTITKTNINTKFILCKFIYGLHL